MPGININRRFRQHTGKRISQGDILRDLKLREWSPESEIDRLTVEEFQMPYSVVMTQECDLYQDSKNRMNDDSETQDKYIHSILLCPAYLAEEFKNGVHLRQLDLIMETHNSKSFAQIKGNNRPRYHYIEGDPYVQVPNLVVDFKHYYSFARDQLYESMNGHYLATLNYLFREELSQRFSAYLSRVGLPDVVDGVCTTPSD